MNRAIVAPFLVAGFAGLACLAGPVSAQVYKWVDAQGRTHYSESPPPEQKDKARKVDMSNAGKGVPAPVKPVAEQEGDFRRRQIEREGKERRAEQEERQREQARQQCVRVRQQLAMLREQVPIFSRDEKGERRYLEDSDRQAEISRLEKFQRDSCS